MKIERIDKCRICGNRNLVPVLDLGVHSLSSIFPRGGEIDPVEAPLLLIKCDDEHDDSVCGLLQLKHTVPGELMYLNHYGYRSGINKIMTNHLNSIVSEIKSRINLKNGDVVLDIGSNDGTLLKAYKESSLTKIGIDPTGNQFKSFYPVDIHLLSDFFSADNFNKISPDKKAKVITSIAMFYDLKEPMKFVNDVKESLHPEGIWIIEQSYMPTMIETNSFDTICHEHFEYYSLKQIKWMMEKSGLIIIDVDFNKVNGGSFRVTVAHKSSFYSPKKEKIENILNKERKSGFHTLYPYVQFKHRIEKIKNDVKEYIVFEKRDGRSVYIYGTSAEGNTFMQYLDLDRDLITAAVERNPEKFGRRTPKTNIPIISEEEARKAKPDNFLVLPGHFKEEFLERENYYINSGGKLIFPLPEFEVVTKEKNNSHGKKALITGVTGQIGSYLAELLLEKGYEVHGIVRRTSSIGSARERIDHIKSLNLHYGDLTDSGVIEKIISEIKPDEIYNLAAQSHVWISFQTPEHTSDINALGVLRLCEAARRLDKRVRIYQASTSELYGGIYDFPVNEDVPFYPKSPYGIAKLYGYWIIKHYREAYDLFCSNGIVFNSESPRRGENFVTRKITKGIADILKGKIEKLYLGNLNAKRDWNHAKDAAEVMWLILQANKPGDYVMASGKTYSVREFVESAFRFIGVEISWKGEGLNEIGYDTKTGKEYIGVDPHYFRPTEVNVLIGDSKKAREELGWNPKYNFEGIVKDMMENELKDIKPMLSQDNIRA